MLPRGGCPLADARPAAVFRHHGLSKDVGAALVVEASAAKCL